jgi:hypothetical protein
MKKMMGKKMMAKKPAAKKAAAKKSNGNAVAKYVKMEMADERKEMAEDKKYRAMADMDTVMRAQEIMADRTRMSEVKKIAAKQAQLASKIAKK